MDDIVIWTRKDDLPTVRSLAQSAVAELSLEIKHGGEWNRCSQGIPFLGFIVYPDRLRVGRMARRRLRGKFRGVQKQFDVGEISEIEFQNRCTSLFSHVSYADDLAWRQVVLSLHGGDDRRRDMLERQSRDPRRLLGQFCQELPSGVSQQEEARQLQQESGLPSLSVPWHEGDLQPRSSPDDASS